MSAHPRWLPRAQSAQGWIFAITLDERGMPLKITATKRHQHTGRLNMERAMRRVRRREERQYGHTAEMWRVITKREITRWRRSIEAEGLHRDNLTLTD